MTSFALGDSLTILLNAMNASWTPLYFINLVTHPTVFGERSSRVALGPVGIVQPGETTSTLSSGIPQSTSSRAVLCETATILDPEYSLYKRGSEMNPMSDIGLGSSR